MGNKKINIHGLILILFVLLTMSSYSQKLNTEELKWNHNDSITMPVFKNTNQIIEWGKTFGPFVSVQSKKISIGDHDVFILMVDICSGRYCPFIYFFERKNKFWELVVSTFANLGEQIEINVDNNQKKIIFKTKTCQIGELPFKTLNLSLNKTEQ